MTNNIRLFCAAFPDADLVDLRDRLARTRWPDAELVDDWSQGAKMAYIRELAEYWRTQYDWRRCEERLNAYPQFVTEIDGLDVHFMHIRSPEPTARPLLMTHGWPGSVLEFMNVIGPLTDPQAHGGEAKDAYHLILPSLPGFGFSGKPTETGWGVKRIAAAWDVLMARLGYDRYLAQGGDWGSMVTGEIAGANRGACAGIHLNLVVVGPPPPEVLSAPTEEEKAGLAAYMGYTKHGTGYAEIQRTKPQSLGYGLADSPAMQLAWIIEKFQGWTGSGDTPEAVFDRDELLDNVTLYWLTNSGTSSARLYWESFANLDLSPVPIPASATIFPREIMQPSQRWMATRFADIRYFRRAETGGHFAALQVPELFVAEVRSGLRGMDL